MEPTEIYSILCGANVTMSRNSAYFRYLLNSTEEPACWYGGYYLGEWIQVATSRPRHWSGVVLQGRGDDDEWVESVKITYTLDGVVWHYV